MLHVKWWSSHFSPDFIVFICISIFSGSEGIVPASFLQLLIDPFLTSQHDIRSRREEQRDSSIQLKHLIVESKPITEKALSHPFSGKRIVKIFFRISHLRLVKTRDKFFFVNTIGQMISSVKTKSISSYSLLLQYSDETILPAYCNVHYAEIPTYYDAILIISKERAVIQKC